MVTCESRADVGGWSWGDRTRFSGGGSWLRVKGAEETQGCGGWGSAALTKGGEVERATSAGERAPEGGADPCEVAGAAGVIVAPDFPVPATAGEPLAERELGLLGRGNEGAKLLTEVAGLLVGDDGGLQLAVSDAAVTAVVGEKRRGWPAIVCVAAAGTAAALPLGKMRYSRPVVTRVRAVS